MLAGLLAVLAACGEPSAAPQATAPPPAMPVVAASVAPPAIQPMPAAAAEPAPEPGADRLDDMVATIVQTGRTAPLDPALVEAPCQPPSPGGYVVPIDFSVRYVISPVAGDWGIPRRLTVTPDGRYRLVELVPPPPGSLDAPAERALADGFVSGLGMRNLYAAVVACRFFDLQGPFFDAAALDGSTAAMRQESTQSLNITADGRSHQVVVRNVPVQRFMNIRSTLFAETRAL